MNDKTCACTISAALLILGLTGSARAQHADMSFFITSVGSGKGADLESYVAGAARMGALIGSPRYPESPESSRARAETTYERGISAAGVLRHMLAVLTQTDRAAALRELDLPATVLHGMNDRMVHVSGGRATARALLGSELLIIDGMGHDLPRDLFDTVIDAIDRTIQRAS